MHQIILQTVTQPTLKLNDYGCWKSPVARYLIAVTNISAGAIASRLLHGFSAMKGATKPSKCFQGSCEKISGTNSSMKKSSNIKTIK